jgi:uncharacterized protein with HEPN domain
MRTNAQIALEYAGDHDDWRQNRLVLDVIAKRVEEVAEAAKTRFPRALCGDYPDIEWDEIAGTRDHLAHEYGKVDLDILGEVVDDRLPRLVSSIDAILAE